MYPHTSHKDKPLSGILYLIPTPLGDDPPEWVMPAHAISILHRLDHLIVENLRTARRLLSKTHIPKSIDSIQFYELNKHSSEADVGSFLDAAKQGSDIGLISEAGSPCIADPGAIIVQQAHKIGIKVVPLAGPNSIMMALMASGFNGQWFVFHGYLPIQANARIKKIRELEQHAVHSGQTQIFIETPYRNQQLFEALMRTCHPSTTLCIAIDISSDDEVILTQSISQWQSSPLNIHKKPAVFLLGTDAHSIQ
ncbi:MAG: SAM-dependent methyltransferase [Bacteroidales bacterium]|jgi:16S rRNA (cytidine1402-2'-O)-methyltransferase|nr:SAM-dependent methyltransferase [Bacteroidales bacterium]MCK9448175.1 SAM-dependent methyltransferase [Bacteroidales bacterium]MDD3700945.1 SAM-dependent methyltransferase [Bacteroidales bacterium]MDY0370019.1 SAM-dependent methyltransferase [Bacteroidales bacterium]